jgi:hypothetical protein
MFKNILKYFILITFTLTSLVGGSLVYANEDISYENLTSSSVDLSWSGSNDIFFYKINY